MGIRHKIFTGLRHILGLRQPPNNILTDEDREKALETRRMQSRVTQLEKMFEMKKRMDIIEKAMGSGSGADIEKMFMMGILGKLFGNVDIPKQQNLNTSATIDFTDEQIHMFINKHKEHIPKLKKMEDMQLFDTLKKVEPKASDKSILRAIALIKNG